MLKVIATQVVISKGYDNKPAISITRGNDSAASVRFRIGKKVYDPKAENNTRCKENRRLKLNNLSFLKPVLYLRMVQVFFIFCNF